jgi:hypothetical protein
MNDHFQIEQYTLGQLPPQERVVFEAKLIIDNDLAEKTALQQEVHKAVILSGRKQLRKEIAGIDRKIFTEKRLSSFRERIEKIFR